MVSSFTPVTMRERRYDTGRGAEVVNTMFPVVLVTSSTMGVHSHYSLVKVLSHLHGIEHKYNPRIT